MAPKVKEWEDYKDKLSRAMMSNEIREEISKWLNEKNYNLKQPVISTLLCKIHGVSMQEISETMKMKIKNVLNRKKDEISDQVRSRFKNISSFSVNCIHFGGETLELSIADDLATLAIVDFYHLNIQSHKINKYFLQPLYGDDDLKNLINSEISKCINENQAIRETVEMLIIILRNSLEKYSWSSMNLNVTFKYLSAQLESYLTLINPDSGLKLQKTTRWVYFRMCVRVRIHNGIAYLN